MTVRDDIRRMADLLTASERKVSSALLADYPFAGLLPIQQMAARCGVSAPSVTRFVVKLGHAGYQQFQRSLISELEEGRRSPVEIKIGETQIEDANFLAGYSKRVADQLALLPESVSQDLFERICGLLADPQRSIYLLGGRVSDSVASFLAIHLRQIRPGVVHLSSNPEHWPDDLLRIRKQDVVVLFDFRRYQPEIARLAHLIRDTRKADIVLLTDRWISPAAEHCDHVVGLPIEVGTAWDTLACAIALAEAFIVRVSEADWDRTRRRLKEWDRLRIGSPPATREHENDDEA